MARIGEASRPKTPPTTARKLGRRGSLVPRADIGSYATLPVPVALWVGAELAQRGQPITLRWALLDEVAHAGVAAICSWPLGRKWGARSVLVAVLSGTVIDVDHAIAARSLAPRRMMRLAERPATHSLLGVLLVAIVTGAVCGRRLGYAAGIGAASHVLRDAVAPPGVPLFTPLGTNGHMVLPAWALPLGMAFMASLSQVLAGCWTPSQSTAPTSAAHRAGAPATGCRPRA
jgi:membrane-bound metal-dependent hydrolase YbcI (DUF457 family)